MTERLLINVSDYETRVALLDTGQLQELHLARANSYSLTGNIYLGRVERVVPGMQAAFVDIGLDRPGFLHARDMDQGAPDGDAEASVDVRSLLRDGQELMVQITKDPIARKGARLTTQLAIASRYLVLTPFSEQLRISQRIEQEEERERLRTLIDEERQRQGTATGFIARTAADSIDSAAVAADMKLLVRIWDRVLGNRRAVGCPGTVYQELPLHIRVLRDLATARLEAILIDHQATYARVRDFVAEFLPGFENRVQLYTEPRALFDRFGVDEKINRALKPQVSLKSGGYLIIEQTEAMITIDVNTGRYLGHSTLEETVFRTNLEAAQVIPQQLRLRNLGGIIVIDFIDMVEPEHQRQVLRALERAAEADPARTNIEGFSTLGLVEISRKRTRESLQQQLTEPCARCGGSGRTRTAATTCAEIFRAIVQDADGRSSPYDPGPFGRGSGEYLIRSEEGVIDRLLDEDADALAHLSRLIGRPIRLQVEPGCGPGEFDLVQGLRR